MLGTFAHGSVLIQRGPHLPVPFCTSLCMRVMEGSHLGIQGMEFTAYEIFPDPVTFFAVTRSLG